MFRRRTRAARQAIMIIRVCVPSIKIYFLVFKSDNRLSLGLVGKFHILITTGFSINDLNITTTLLLFHVFKVVIFQTLPFVHLCFK